MKPDLMMWIEGTWYRRHRGAWDTSKEPLPLAAPTRIVTDFGNAIAGVMAVDTRPEFAAPVIEKRLRSEGLVDGESRVIAHRVVPAGGGCRVFYTAVPIPAWQDLYMWLRSQRTIGLVFPIEAAMLALAQRYGAVLLRTGRQLRFVASRGNLLVFVSTTAFSDDVDDVDTALRSLADQVAPLWSGRSDDHSLLWCDLIAAGDDEGRLANVLGERLGAQVTHAPVTELRGIDGVQMRTAIDYVVNALSWKSAANPLADRIGAAANEMIAPVAIAAGLIGMALCGTAMYYAQQTEQLASRTAQTRQASDAISRRIAGLDVPVKQVLAGHEETIAFLTDLERAARSPDPSRFLNDLRTAANQQVRVMRVRMTSPDGVYRVDGVPAADVTSERALSGFLGALRAAGYQVTPEDPGTQGNQPGFFSYSVRPAARAGASS